MIAKNTTVYLVFSKVVMIDKTIKYLKVAQNELHKISLGIQDHIYSTCV